MPYPLQGCQVTGCTEGVPPSLTGEGLCRDHFIEQVFAHAQQALEMCQQGRTVDLSALDREFSNAGRVLKTLAPDSREHSTAQRERILELLLCLANIHEYLHHPAGKPTWR